jgi:hypothetical protein
LLFGLGKRWRKPVEARPWVIGICLNQWKGAYAWGAEGDGWSNGSEIVWSPDFRRWLAPAFSGLHAKNLVVYFLLARPKGAN